MPDTAKIAREKSTNKEGVCLDQQAAIEHIQKIGAENERQNRISDTDRKKYAYRAMYRGTKEADILMRRVVDARLPGMSSAELGLFARLCECSDHDIILWLRGAPPPPPFAGTFIEGLRRAVGYGSGGDCPQESERPAHDG